MAAHTSSSADRGPSKINVTIVYNGAERTISAQPNANVRSLLEHAIREFGISSQPHLLSLFRANGTKVDESQSIEAAGITDSSVLYLRQDAVKGG